MLAVLKTIWRNWKRFAHGINGAIAWVLMSIVYVTAMFPVAMGFRVFKPDALDRGLGDPEATSHWLPVPGEPQDVRRAQRPW